MAMSTPSPTPPPPSTSGIQDPVVAALIAMLQTGTSPQILALQQALLQRLILQGDVIPSAIPPPANITQVGGYLNLLGTLGLNQLRTEVLASALGVAPPALITPILGGSQTAPSVSTPGAPNPTSSTSLVMAGLDVSYTPMATGRLRVTVQATLANSVAGDGGQIQLEYGTGATPANGAPLTGTPAGGAAQATSATAGSTSTLTLEAIILGLAVNQAVWLDLAYAAVTGGSFSLSNLTVLIEEF